MNTSCPRPREGGPTPWRSATLGTKIGMQSSITPRPCFSKSRATSENGRCCQGISQSGCLRAAIFPRDWRLWELRCISTPSTVMKIVGVRNLARTAQTCCHCDVAHGRAVPNKSVQVSHAAVPPERRPLEVRQARDCGWAQGWFRQAPCACRFVARSTCVPGCQRRADRGRRRTLVIPLPPGQPAPNPPMNNFDREDAETQYDEQF